MASLGFFAADQGAIDALVNRKNVVTIPTYLLRWVPYTGVHQVILRIALEQLFYLNQHRSADGEGKVKADLSRYGKDHAVETRYVDLERWCAMSERTIIRHLEDSPLFEKSNQGCEVVDDHYQQKANRYHLPALRLTPGDAADLLSLIQKEHTAGTPLIDLLEKLEKTAISDIASQKPYRMPQETDSFNAQPPGLKALFEQTYGPIPPDLLGRIEKLQFDLINPLNAFLTIPWYWFLELLPVVGHQELMAYLMCIPLTFRDRTHFTLTGGARAIADWVGKSTLALSFPRGNGTPSRSSAAARKLARQRAELGLLFQPQENRKGRKNTYQITLKRNPLLPHHQAALDVILTLDETALTHIRQALSAIENATEEDETPVSFNPDPLLKLLGKTIRRLKTEKPLAFDSLSWEKILAFDNLNLDFFLAFDNPNAGKPLASVNPDEQKGLAFDNLNPQKPLAPDSLFKILNRFKIPQIINKMPSNQDSGPPAEGGQQLNQPLREALIQLLDQPIPETHQRDAAAWMLEGFTQPEITDPPGYAHYKAIRKKRPGPKDFLAMLQCPLAAFIAITSSKSALELAYYKGCTVEKAVYTALKDCPWEAVQRIRQALMVDTSEKPPAPETMPDSESDPNSGAAVPAACWPAVLRELQNRMPPHLFSTWFEGTLTLLEAGEGAYVLACTNEAVVQEAEAHRPAIEAAICAHAASLVRLVIRVDDG
jgi:hypothetical protein